MAKQDEVKKVPPDAVGKATVETTQPDGATTVKTVPASEVKVQPEPTAPAVPRRATRQTRDQRQRTRQQALTRRQEARRQRPARTSQARQVERQAQREANLEERTITVSLPAHTWAALDRRVTRSGQDVGNYLRRLLTPLLR